MLCAIATAVALSSQAYVAPLATRPAVAGRSEVPSMQLNKKVRTPRLCRALGSGGAADMAHADADPAQSLHAVGQPVRPTC